MKTRCELCFHHCELDEGQTGMCRARGCRGGGLVPLSYGKLTCLALDPIEKKPLRRFYPGSLILSVGSFGCNLRCPFCQNHEISMVGDGEIPITIVSPEQLAAKAAELVPREILAWPIPTTNRLLAMNMSGTALSWSMSGGWSMCWSPTGRLRKHLGGRLPLIDAVNIDLKSFSDTWYRKLGGDLEAVKRSIALAAEQCHVEVTTLLVPGENDTVEEIRELACWLAGADPSIPLHLSRFFPRYRMTGYPPTPVERVYRLAEEARAYLTCVYTGNC